MDAKHPVGVSWEGPALVNGQPWPLTDGATVWLPAGHFEISGGEMSGTENTSGEAHPGVRVSYLNGDLLSAKTLLSGAEFEYRSRSRAIALFEDQPARIAVDGQVPKAAVLKATNHWAILLPPGQHRVQIFANGLLP